MSNLSMKTVAIATVVGGVIAGALTASAALNLPTQSCAFVFNSNMKLGSRGADVKNLQVVLNGWPQTRVAASGAGSPGMETTTFGPATRAAANKFQSLHLAELGISAPTGNVFAGTRALLNQACSVGTVPGTTPGTIPGTVPTNNPTGPVSVMLGGSQPTGMLVAGQAGGLLANLTFTGNGTVTNIELQRIGVSADSALSNVYLYDGNTRITDAASVVTGGFIRFNAASGLFVVNGTRNISVRADIASGTSGNSVGVKLNSVTAMGGTASAFTNVMGNTLQVGSATPAAANFSTVTVANTNVDAGTLAYNIWSGSVTVSTRDVNLKAATYKFVGSAPVDALANISLYVDGTKVAGPTTINASNNNKISFDLGMTPFLMKTGTHTMDVRADVVKGSFRTVNISIENVADLMMEDTALTGVNVAATVGNAAMTQSNSTYRQITVNKGSVTVNVDPTFNATQVTGGATNVPVGQFLLKAYGEDVKVNSLQVDLATTTNALLSTFNNVTLYVNGGQVGTSQNMLTTTAAAGLTFTLGSSLVIPAGTTVTLTVKADLVNSSNAAYTSGTVAAVVGGVSSNAQGMSSNEMTDVAASAVTGNTLTISSGAGTFARTAGFTAISVAPNTSGVKIGSWTIQASSAEGIKVNSIGVNPVVGGYNGTAASSVANAITNYSNLTLKTGSTVLGTPVGNPASGTSTFSFQDIVIPANGSQTFDVYADIGGNASSTANPTVTAAMDLTSRGVVSNTTVVNTAGGVAISSAAATLANPTLAGASPLAQYVVGGSTFGIATYTLSTAVAGTQATVTEMRFRTAGTDAITSITVGGTTVAVNGTGTTTITGLNIPVTSSGTDVPVTVKFSGFQGSTSGGSLQTSVSGVQIALGHVQGTSGTGSVITNTTVASSSLMTLVASKPTVSVGAGNTDTLILGVENKIGEFTVTADANGKISLGTTSLSLSSVGVTGIEASSTAMRIADGSVTIPNTTASGSTTVTVTFTTPYQIPAGTSKTFSLFGIVNGAAQTGVTPYMTSRLTSGASFVWYDNVGGVTGQNGTAIYNFPTASFTTKR